VIDGGAVYLVEEDAGERLLPARANARELVGFLILPPVNVFQLIAQEVGCQLIDGAAISRHVGSTGIIFSFDLLDDEVGVPIAVDPTDTLSWEIHDRCHKGWLIGSGG
jgi:hypothetical protein